MQTHRVINDVSNIYCNRADLCGNDCWITSNIGGNKLQTCCTHAIDTDTGEVGNLGGRQSQATAASLQLRDSNAR